MATAKKKITTAPKKKAFTGSLLLTCEPFTCTPDSFLDRLGFAKQNRPVFKMRPMNAKERHFMEADQNNMTAEGMLWVKEKGLDILDEKNQYMITSKFATYSDSEGRKEIVRGCILGVSGGGIDEPSGIDKETFDRLPLEIINLLEAELLKKANLSNDEVLGL